MKAIARFDLETIAAWCSGRADANGHIGGVSTDTRTIAQGDLFVALVGPNFDGHDFIETAVERGAGAVLVSRAVETTVPQIRVVDTLLGLQAISRALFLEMRERGVRSIALTGSNGKTTTKELVASLLVSAGIVVHATPGNLNNHIGVPLTICACPEEVDVIVVEMGANRFGDIAELIEIAPADVRIVTSIGYAHIENLGDLDGVRRVKSEIFQHAGADTVAIVPFDERERLALRGFPGLVYTAGFAQGADAVVRSQRDHGHVVSLEIDASTRRILLPIPGPHNAQNLALAWMAVTAGLGVQLTDSRVQAQFAGFSLPGGRLKRISMGDWEFIDDAYNANPTSARASFDAFLEMDGPGPRIAVFGEMRELGDKSAQLHGDLARSIASRGGVDYLVFVGNFADEMEKAAIQVGPEARVYATPEIEAAATFVQKAGPGFVFLKASRGAELERIIEKILPKSSTEI